MWWQAADLAGPDADVIGEPTVQAAVKHAPIGCHGHIVRRHLPQTNIAHSCTAHGRPNVAVPQASR